MSRPIATAIASPLLSRRVAPCCPVVLRLSLLSHCVTPSVPSRPVYVALPVSSRRTRPVRPAHPSHPCCVLPVRRAPCALPVRRAPCALPVRRALCALPVRHAPAASCLSVTPCAPCPSAPVAPVPASSSIHLYASVMATPRVLRFDAEGRPLEFSVRLLRARRLLESQVQTHETLWAHASGDLPEPADPAPLATDPTPADSDRYARERAGVTVWKWHDAAACIALSNLLLESEETHFTQVRTSIEFLTAIKARYTTPATVSLGRLFLPFLFPDLASFERTADLITHLRSLDSSYRTACTDAQLALLPPPMAITIYFIANSLPDRLASVRDALLLKHPSELTIEVLESALKDVESNLRSVASASGAVPPPLFHGCTVPQLPTFTASLATAATDVTAAAATTSSRSRGRSGRRGGQGAGGGGGGGGGDVASGGSGSAGAGGAPRAAASDSPAAAGGGDARVRQPPTGLSAAGGGAAAWTRLTTPFTTPLHHFFDSRDVRFDESVPYYVRYPCRGLPVPPPPLFLTSAPPPAPPVQPPPPGPTLLGVSHATPPPSVAPQVQPPSPQSSSQHTADPTVAGFRGEDPGGASSRGARVGTERVPVRGPGSGGAGVGAELVTVGDSSLRGAGVSGAVPGDATTGGAPSAGPGEPRTDLVTSGGAGSGGGATGSLESGPGATTAPDTTPLPHPYPTRHQARRVCRALAGGAAAAAAAATGAGAATAATITAGGAAVAATAGAAAPATSSSCLCYFPSSSAPLSPPLSHTWPSRRSPCARPSSPVPFTDLSTALFHSSLPRSSPSVIPSPPESALTASLSSPVTDYYRMYRPVLSRVLASLVTDPRASLSSVSALTAAVTEFASTRCLDYATSLVAAPPTSPLAVGGESALGCDALEDRQFELKFLAAASPHLCAMLLAPEGDPDALDIPTPRTYAKAVVKRPPGSPPVFKARYVARGFSQREGVDFFQTFAPTPKMTTLQLLLHVPAQRDYELHSLDFSTDFLQGSLHEEVWLRCPSAFTDTFPPGTQWRLRRPCYSLRQAPREWHDTLRSTLYELGFQPSSADPSLFVRRGSTPFFVLVYVVDLVFATADRVDLADVKLEMQKRRTCIDLGELRHYLGELRHYLGLQITRDRAARTITLSQSHMVQQILQRFELQHSTVQRTPLAVDHRLTGTFPDEPFEPSGPYAELVGCLIYLMTCTRPDLAFPLSILACFVAPERHRPAHWTAAVRVAKYLATTSGVGLVLGGRQDVVLTGHCDSSYGDDAEMHRST
ncbi:unnamed protein product [Closterium sp. NIES-54]